MRIPEIQRRLRSLADEMNTLADELSRRSPIKRSANVSAKMTPELEGEIRAFCFLHPSTPHRIVAEKFNVNPGRVSEIVRGKRQ